MAHGIQPGDIRYIINTLAKFPEVEKASIFGSRALGNFKKGSDIDLALHGDKVNFTTIAHVKDLLQEDSPMPYLFDVVDYTHCQSEELKNHIDQFGQTIYTK
ncbi:Nucleotidyltransferase domain-containing protein [Saccharicrinis carchari]|uniref:Nucleotidyltransferase domain-containing protein n=1 Tax=Saccharicrinis carchari TaxID=1168039 RepID=A0A521ALG4_SACCC|nr:nucleotidyltransferase domain-containing protein [Saccharicrinis carchari]SMO35623.1 Nucleotidyltransferase domain-containing protein [Saccharicrinis carchari]